MTCHHLFFPVYSVTHSVRQAVRPPQPLVWTHKVPAVYVVFTCTYFFCLECSEISHQGSQQEGWDFFQYKSSTWCLGRCLSPKNALGNCQKWGRTGMSPPGTSHVHLLQPPQPLPWSPTSCTDDKNLMCLWLLWINHSGYRVYLGAAFAWVWHALGNQISQCICSEYVPVLQGRPPKSHLERSCAWLWVKLVINSRNWS